jgi:hypothetical protein
MTNPASVKKILLTLLNDPDGKSLFYFHEQFSLPPSELYLLAQELSSKGFIRLDDERLFITTYGKHELIANKKKYFLDLQKPWLAIPKEMKGDRISTEDFYTPQCFDKKYRERLEGE